MTRRIFKSRPASSGCAAVLASLLLASCAAPALRAPDPTGLVVAAARPLPPGVEPAWIVEIDGEPVPWRQTTHRLATGPHRIRVVPRVEGPPEQVPSAEALATHWSNEPVRVEVEEGRTYVIGLRMLERLDQAGRRGRWQAVVTSVHPSDR